MPYRRVGRQRAVTHPPIGDRGQRYELVAIPYDDPNERPIAWAATLAGAEQWMAGFRLWPFLRTVWILDRETGQIVGEKVAAAGADRP